MSTETNPLAVITGASSGIGYELARCCAAQGYDLVVVADEDAIHPAAKAFECFGVQVTAVQADLATAAGADKLCDCIGARAVDVLMANAGHGLGKAFVEQSFTDVLRVIDTNITGAMYLVQRVACGMRERGSGRILFTGSGGGLAPGPSQAIYNASKAFVDTFALALGKELKGSGVTVTCLMPGATDTRFFERAGIAEEAIAHCRMDDAADVARAGFEAMLRGQSCVVAGLWHTLDVLGAHRTPYEAPHEIAPAPQGMKSGPATRH